MKLFQISIFFILLLASLNYAYTQNNKSISTSEFESIIQNLIICSTHISSDDDMFTLQLIDTISNRCTINPQYFNALNCISSKADGFIGEYLWEIMQFQFFHNYALFSTFLFENCNSTTEIQLFLVEGLSIYVDDSKRKTKAKREIHQLIKKSSSFEVRKFMKNIEGRICSNILD